MKRRALKVAESPAEYYNAGRNNGGRNGGRRF